MSRFKKAIACLIIILASLPAFSQEPMQQDTLVVLDSMHQDTDSQFDEDTEITESTLTNRPLPVIPDTLSFRKVSDSIAATLKKQKAFEYANDPAYWVRQPEPSQNISFNLWKQLFAFFNRPAVRAVVYLLLAALVVFLLIKIILVNNLYIFRSSNKKAKRNDVSNDAALMEEDLDELLRDAIERNDQRAVVRFHYLKTLKLLDRKGWINFHPQATNLNYRAQVNNFAKGKEFSFLSSAYEHVWFGNFQLTREQYDIVVHHFNHFQNALKV